MTISGKRYSADAGLLRKMAIEEKVKTYQIDAILPVPLNHRKQFKRGYNQSQKLAEGISNKLNIPINEKLLQRTQNNVSQTKKSRFQRWDNVSSSFEIKDLKTYKHILIVDDVQFLSGKSGTQDVFFHIFII